MVAADVLVVGAGVVGACAAYLLARAGARVEVVDADLPGGATAAATGMISPGTALLRDAHVPPGFLPLAFQSGTFYAELLAWLAADGETDCGCAQVGSLLVARDDAEAAELPALAHALEQRHASGVPLIGQIERLSAVDARALFPPLAHDLAGAIFIPSAARVDGRSLVQAVKRAATRKGARFRQGFCRLQVSPDGALNGMRLDGEPPSASAVLLAAGAWSPDPSAGDRTQPGIGPMRGQVLDLRLDADDTARWPTVRGFTDTSYMVAFAGGRVVLGATREAKAGFDARLTAAGINEVLSGGLRLAPDLRRATFLKGRVGLRPVTRDGLPIIGNWPGRQDVFVCAGNGAYGLLMGPYCAAVITRLLAGGPPGVDLNPFDPLRFVSTRENVRSPG